MVAVLKPEYVIRPMRRSDADAVHEIEQDSYPYPWSRGIFSDCMRIGYCCRVAECTSGAGGDIGGYAILSAAAGEAHLLNLCVAPAHRRQGLGQLLLDGVFIDARLLRARRLFLEVRPSNHGAVALYRQNEFRVIGRRPDYYPGYEGREDALVMVHHLEDPPGEQSS
ncbi:MAG: ribosomal protein S18-alanine N-acetyltransferase [Wenzhouxiangellaceae bacterium]|jgi:ribosomal-protein-alanine N-acetyltransferase|nr:ribosomal protein S18-alanine N-acetyltransferase [Wenzhouxiangellaceae bacterium]MBS3745831.1 ribosomal protein S18-alanine N-acetyltransferase [Wenzhouxiangellaceae bacterium]MBS3824254.1 ribosomal protein S18-alanine N-acetyltransferase [Wenzhouxiangellaceae bacterium]